MKSTKPVLRALAGEALPVPPVWIMRQAGRYLPEYRATREKAGDFLSLCYNSDFATEVTLQPIRRFDFDASIIFADILLIPHALGADLSFVEGEGPRLSAITGKSDFDTLKGADDIHETLAPVYQTMRNLSSELPKKCALIGFAGAPWTVATYMIAGKGTPDQGPARKFKTEQRAAFQQLMDLLTEATINYLNAQISAGAEIVKLFDTWAGCLTGQDFEDFAVQPVAKIISGIREKHPEIPVIAFPREAGMGYVDFHEKTGANCVAVDHFTTPSWAAQNVQPGGCVQGNLDPVHMVDGGADLVSQTKKVVSAFSNGPHIFNLGHGITPDANPKNVHLMIDTIRGN